MFSPGDIRCCRRLSAIAYSLTAKFAVHFYKGRTAMESVIKRNIQKRTNFTSDDTVGHAGYSVRGLVKTSRRRRRWPGMSCSEHKATQSVTCGLK